MFPDRQMPPFVERELEIRWAAADAPREVPVPASDAAITIYEFELDPQPLGERFEDGRRYLLLPAGTEVTGRCHLRAWGPAPIPAPAALFPGATSIRDLP